MNADEKFSDTKGVVLNNVAKSKVEEKAILHMK